MKINTLAEFHPLQVAYREIMLKKKAFAVVTSIHMTEEEYLQVAQVMQAFPYDEEHLIDLEGVPVYVLVEDGGTIAAENYPEYWVAKRQAAKQREGADNAK
jgi:hypothetical protein